MSLLLILFLAINMLATMWGFIVIKNAHRMLHEEKHILGEKYDHLLLPHRFTIIALAHFGVTLVLFVFSLIFFRSTWQLFI